MARAGGCLRAHALPIALALGLLAGCAAPAPPAAPLPDRASVVTPPAPPPPEAPDAPRREAAGAPRLPPAPTLPPGPTWIARPPAPTPLDAPPPASPAPAPRQVAAAVPRPPPPATPAPAQPAAAAVPRPGVGPQERRQPVDSTVAPWRSIGMVVAEGAGRCTGAVIGPRTVLTAAHCLVNPRTGEPMAPQSIAYVIGPTAQGPGRRVAVASFAVAPGFRVGPGPRPLADAPADADWAVLQLDPSVPAAPPEFILPLVSGLMPQWTVLALGGFQPDRGAGLFADLECWVLGYSRFGNSQSLLRHSCAATGGSSGGPLLVRTPDGQWMVAGVASLALRNGVGGWAVPSLAVTRGLQALGL